MFELNNYLEFEKNFENLVTRELPQLYAENKFEKLSDNIFNILKFYGSFNFHDLSESDYYRLNIFADNFLRLFILDDFIIPEADLEKYLVYHSLIANLVYLSDLRTTDQFIRTLLNNRFDNFLIDNRNKAVKLFTLYSARNTVVLDYRCLFASDPEAASLWYWQYFGLADFSTGPLCRNFENHMDQIGLIDENAIIPTEIKKPFFHSTYVHPEKDKLVKQKINSLLRERYKNITISNPETDLLSNKIAIISGLFYPGHPVFKGTYKFIEALAENYELTLINLSGYQYNHTPNIFKNEINLKIDTGSFDLSKIPDDFILAVFPDIGMTNESIFLANLRIAPVQIGLPGHSASSHGAQVDYFISGLKSEVLEKAGENYSERLVLLPGIGLHIVGSNRELFENITGTVGSSSPSPVTLHSSPEILIACPWSYMKVNHHHLRRLEKIKQLSQKKIKFRFFPSAATHSQILSFCLTQELTEIFGSDYTEVMDFTTDFESYLKLLNEADLVIDSFHFGGYTTVTDALALGKPVVTFDGDKAYNKFASAILRTFGLPELIAENEAEYISKVVELVNNESFRLNISEKIKENYEPEILFNDREAGFFGKAVDYLLLNHQTLQKQPGRQPVIIEEALENSLGSFNEVTHEFERLLNSFNKKPLTGRPLNIVMNARFSAPFDGDTPLHGPLAGTESSFIYMSRELARAGHQVAVFTPHCTNKFFDGVYYDRPENLITYCDSNPVDILVIHKHEPLLKEIKAKIVIFWAKGDTDQAATIEFLENSFNGKIVDRIFTISNYQKGNFIKFADIAENKFFLTKNGINPEYFSEDRPRKKYKLLYTSIPNRGLELLAGIFPKIRERVPEAYLEYYSALKHYGLADVFDKFYYSHIHDKLNEIEGITRKDLISHPEMAKELAEAYLLVYPNIVNESFCISALEAQAAGTPIVTSARGALPETVEDGKTGICIPGEPLSDEYQEQFVEAVVSLLSDPLKWQEYSARGKERSMNDFPWEKVAGEWVEEFERLLGNFAITKEFFNLAGKTVKGQNLSTQEKITIYRYFDLMMAKFDFSRLKNEQKEIINYFISQPDFPKNEKMLLMLLSREVTRIYQG
jgi:glycosyltransferase involved in cell wall biosynthesis